MSTPPPLLIPTRGEFKELTDEPIKIPTEKTLELMAIQEEQIRRSQEYQDLCTQKSHVINGWLEVTEEMQEGIAYTCGFQTQVECNIACNMARRAHILYPQNPIFTSRTQVKYNKARQGDLKVGDPIPPITLHTLDGQTINLQTITQQDSINNKPTIIFGGSQT